LVRNDLYSYLIRHNYNLPVNFSLFKSSELKKNIQDYFKTLNNNIELQTLNSIMVYYDNNRFNKVVLRLYKNGHKKSV
jgi:hypothetical protein